VKRYPLAAKMSKNAFDSKPEFPSSKSSRTYEKIYRLAAAIQSACDFLLRIYCSSDLAVQERLEFCSFS
jgi:hypothetical protein